MKNIVINSDKIKGYAEIVIKLIIIALFWKLMLLLPFLKEIKAKFANTTCPVYPVLILSIFYVLMAIRLALSDLKKNSFISSVETTFYLVIILVVAGIISSLLVHDPDQSYFIGFIIAALGMIGCAGAMVVSLILINFKVFKSKWLKATEHNLYKKLKF